MSSTHSQHQIQLQLQQAQQWQQQGQLAKAEALYLELLTDVVNTPLQEPVLGALCHLYLRSQKNEQALIYLQKLHRYQPTNESLLNQLIQLYSHQKQWQQICDSYQHFFAQPLAQMSNQANHQFNYGYYLKQAGHYLKAIEQFQLAIDNRISQAEDVHLNMAIVYSEYLRQENNAKQSLLKAVALNSKCVPALYNLATLVEEEGDKDGAKEYFRQTLAIDPNHVNALARLADLEFFNTTEHPLIAKLQSALARPGITSDDQINVHYALGKAFNDCKLFEQAFKHYQKANALNGQLLSPYQPNKTEQFVADNMRVFDKHWFKSLKPISTKPCIFICGMFRSGSTLTEQILAAHPNMIAGGEIDFIPNLIEQKFHQYPNSFTADNLSQLEQYASEYLEILTRIRAAISTEDKEASNNNTEVDLEPDEKCAELMKAINVSDKRPDNFLYIGLIKTLFPNAKIIHSLRNKQDNCVSLYFLRLHNLLNYACDFDQIEHFYDQHIRLMDHWKSVFANDVFTLHYEDLVSFPNETINNMLHFLELPWHDNCLKFSSLKNRVKTASVWKVRQPLFSSSVNRYEHYQRFIEKVKK